MAAEAHAVGHEEISVEQLAQRYRAPLMSYFARRMRSVGEAEDLTQEVFLRVVRRIDTPDIENAEAYIFQIAANLLRDRGRREAVRNKYLADAPLHGPVTEILTPERVLQGKEGLQTLMSALNELSEQTRLVFLLYHMENIKYREIAEMLAISPSAVERHMVKALAFISKRVDAP